MKQVVFEFNVADQKLNKTMHDLIQTPKDRVES